MADKDFSPGISRDGAPDAPSHTTVDFLLRRMRHRRDFPAFSQHIIEINEKTSPSGGNYASASELANTILKDYSLTSKLLQLVNSAYYGHLTGKVTTVSRAVVVLGFDQVRLAAASIMLFEHLKDHGQRIELQDETVHSFMRGVVAKGIAESIGMEVLEEAFICSMIHHLGKHLIIYYLPEEYERINALVAKGDVDERNASRKVLGLTFREIGKKIATTWKFPEKIVSSMEELSAGKVSALKSEGDALRKISAFSNELCTIAQIGDNRERDALTDELLNRFGDCFTISKERIFAVISASTEELQLFSRILHLNLGGSDFLKNLTSYGMVESGNVAQDGREKSETFDILPEVCQQEGPQDVLTSGIEDVSDLLLDTFELRDVINMILEIMYRGCRFDHVLFCMTNSTQTKMVARLGFGKDLEEIIKEFRFFLGKTSDVFGLALSLGKDIRIDDAYSPRLKGKIPGWFRKALFSPAFVLFPILIDGKPVALLYADRDKAGKIMDENQLNYLRILRNQAALAIKQKR